MRRYDINVSNTSDFDTKLYANKQKVKSKKLEGLLVDELSKFVTFLNSERPRFLTNERKVYNVDASERFSVVTILLTSENQFRLRYIKKNRALPIDLFSLDFRARIEVHYRETVVNMNIDIPFLDIAIISNGTTRNRYKKSDVVSVDKSSVVPVVNLDFLLEDLNKTYTTPNLAAARYWNDKIGKDTYRYRVLQKIKHTGISDAMETDEVLDSVVSEQVWQGMNSPKNIQQGEEYANAFKHIMESSKRDKYKMRFTEFAEDTDIDRETDMTQLADSNEMDMEIE